MTEFLVMTKTPTGATEALLVWAKCIESAKEEVRRMWREVVWVIPN